MTRRTSCWPAITGSTGRCPRAFDPRLRTAAKRADDRAVVLAAEAWVFQRLQQFAMQSGKRNGCTAAVRRAEDKSHVFQVLREPRRRREIAGQHLPSFH